VQEGGVAILVPALDVGPCGQEGRNRLEVPARHGEEERCPAFLVPGFEVRKRWGLVQEPGGGEAQAVQVENRNGRLLYGGQKVGDQVGCDWG
jgi:hypothetical protein